jgi:hypothetical protein
MNLENVGSLWNMTCKLTPSLTLPKSLAALPAAEPYCTIPFTRFGRCCLLLEAGVTRARNAHIVCQSCWPRPRCVIQAHTLYMCAFGAARRLHQTSFLHQPHRVCMCACVVACVRVGYTRTGSSGKGGTGDMSFSGM